MSPRSNETEAGGVGAVHLADRRTADERTNQMIRFVGQFVALLLSDVGFWSDVGVWSDVGFWLLKVGRLRSSVPFTPGLRRCRRCLLRRSGRSAPATRSRA